MSKLYLRVGSQWSLLFEPKDTPTYMVNVTTTPVLFQKYSTPVSNLNTISHPFTLGGLIGEACIPANEYCYVKAMPLVLADGTYRPGDVTIGEDGSIVVPEGIVTTSDSPNVIEDVATLQRNLAYLTTEVMHLATRVTDGHVKDIYHHLDYVLFLRNFLRHVQKTHYGLSHLQSQILSLRLNIYNAEGMILDLKRQMFDVNYKLQGFDDKPIGDQFESLTVELGQLSAQVASLLSNVLYLQDRVENGEIGDAASAEKLEEVTKELTTLHTHFTTLNNSIVTIADHTTEEEVNQAYDELMATTPEEIQPIFTTVKDTLVQVIKNKEICDKAVLVDDQIILDGSTSLIDALSKENTQPGTGEETDPEVPPVEEPDPVEP